METSDSLLAALGEGRFREVEDACLDRFRAGRLRDPHERTAAAILVAQARVLGRADARGGMSALLAALADAGWSTLDASDLLRANVVATIAVTAPERDLVTPRGLDRALSVTSLQLGRETDLDLRALAAVAMLGGGVDLPDPTRAAKLGPELADDLGCARAPVTQCLAIEAAAALDAAGRIPLIDRGLEIAREISFDAGEARLLLALGGATSDRDDRARAFESAKAALRRGGIAAPWLFARART